MKEQRNILIAFLLNLFFSVFEFIGGTLTGSVAIVSDAVHDLGDAASIGLSYLLERKSKKQGNKLYTYGYARYSVVASVIITLILLFGSCAVIYNGILRLLNPVSINYDGMIVLAVIGTLVNLLAVFFTNGGKSLNQKAINLHMLEDVLGWIVVLIGAVVMRFTDISIIDPVMSIAFSAFILISALMHLREAVDLFLEKAPKGIDAEKITEAIMQTDGVLDVHHIHIWSIDGITNLATMHIVTNENMHDIKHRVRETLEGLGISHSTLELETYDEHCHEDACHLDDISESKHYHGHHHHH